LPDDVTDTELEARLFASAGAGPGTRRGHRRQAEPDWAAVHRELRRKHMTLSIVWEEYIAGEPGGYRYSRFCELYRAWEGRLSMTMRQSHAAGDKLFVDYAGDGVPVVIDRRTGERRAAQIFVAVLGASSFTYAQATWTQGLADWISGHVGAFEAIGGVPALLVPDNTKVAVIKACLFDHIGAIGDQRRQTTGGPRSAVSLDDAAHGGFARIVVKENTTTAIDLDVDEAGREDRAGGKCRYPGRHRVFEADALGEAARNPDQRRPPHDRSVKQLRRGDRERPAGRGVVHEVHREMAARANLAW
jgi:hypothetical protein